MNTNKIPTTNSKKKRGAGWQVVAIFAIIIAFIYVCIGFNKILIYENTSYSTINSYVGGDAYNYIINANYAIAYFVLAGIHIMAAIGCCLMWNLRQIRNKLKFLKTESKIQPKEATVEE